MIRSRVRDLYLQHIRELPLAERMQLLALIAQDLAIESDRVVEQPKHDIMELHGLGKEIWEGIDAQEYVNELRDEWDRDNRINEA